MSLEPLSPEIERMLLAAKPRVFDLVVPRKNNHLDRFSFEHGLLYVSGFEMYRSQFVRQFELYAKIAIDASSVEEIARRMELI